MNNYGHELGLAKQLAKEARPVIAVIPHYNMPATLVPLLGQVIEQGYDAVYVLDDKSTVCDIQELLAPFGMAVTLIAAKENLGAGGNRNRILAANAGVPGRAILHFIDADCELASDGIPAEARRIIAGSHIGAVGGLIVNADGSCYEYNFNPRMSWQWCFAVNAQRAIVSMARHNPGGGRKLRQAFAGALAGFPDIFVQPAPQDIFCAAEANMLILYETFAAAGGFDASLRHSEAQSLAYRLAGMGLKERFDPSIVVKHHAAQVRGKKRTLDNLRSVYGIASRHGFPLK
jgi:GT2 family glycosyltransferase